MQGVDLKKHQSMLKASRQFEELLIIYGHIVPQDHETIIKDKISELKDSYDCYCVLLKELEDCIDIYREVHDALQRTMFPYVRKMTTQSRKKRGY